MKQKILDANKYKGEWVALDPNTREVISHDPVFKKARAAAKKRGVERPIMHGVPESDGYFIGGNMISGT